jgi:hypothetical protein
MEDWATFWAILSQNSSGHPVDNEKANVLKVRKTKAGVYSIKVGEAEGVKNWSKSDLKM